MWELLYTSNADLEKQKNRLKIAFAYDILEKVVSKE